MQHLLGPSVDVGRKNEQAFRKSTAADVSNGATAPQIPTNHRNEFARRQVACSVYQSMSSVVGRHFSSCSYPDGRPPEGAGSGDRPGGRNEGAERNADHVVDRLVASRLAGIEEERL